MSKLAGAIASCVRSSQKRQMLLIGPENSGKTSFLCSMKLPNWRRDDMITALTRAHDEDVAFHYDEVTTLSGVGLGMWDLPGREALRDLVWPQFYRYLTIDVVALVVRVPLATQPLEQKRLTEMEEMGRWLSFLCCEEELRKAVFLVVVNVDRPPGAREPDPLVVKKSQARWAAVVAEAINEAAVKELCGGRLATFWMDVLDARSSWVPVDSWVKKQLSV